MTKALLIQSRDDIAEHVEKIKDAATKAHAWIADQSNDPIEFLRNIKFEKRGLHPVSHYALNLIEQINQTWTYLVALDAAKKLIELHPKVGGFTLAPGAHASQALDIMSVQSGLVGAETFAATSLKSNNKLNRDLDKLRNRTEQNRYVFFACPNPIYQETKRHDGLSKYGVEVWSIKV